MRDFFPDCGKKTINSINAIPADSRPSAFRFRLRLDDVPFPCRRPRTPRETESWVRPLQPRACAPIGSEKSSIEALVRLGYLPEAQQQDVKAVQEAVEIYVADAPFMKVG
jgi:hypothetical protein